jgi:hypothetical protein
MKQTYYKIFFLSLFVFLLGNIMAQNCASDFKVTTTSTPSTCQANGTVTVTLSGDTTNLFNIQYGLTSDNGFTINPQEHNVLTNVPAGKYSVSVRAFCRVNSDYDVVKTVSNVTVGGNYKVPSASFNATSSRKSYDICNTGIIVLNVTDGSGNFTFNIKSAPAGVATGAIIPAKSVNLYTFPGENYPAGDYVVEIEDGCYTAVCSFTLGQISGFPAFSNTSYTGFRPTLIDNMCNQVYWLAGTVNTSNPDYYRYYQDGMYQVGVAPAGSTPTAWVDWITSNLVSSKLLLDISPYNYSDFYTANSISVFTKLKGCDSGYNTLTTYMRSPYMTNSISNRGCENYLYTIRPWTDYDGLFCYPLSIEVTKVSDGQVVFNNPSWSYSASGQNVTLDYDTGYRITMTDSNGKSSTTTVNTDRKLIFTSDLINCDYYQLQYYAPGGTTCWPIRVTITDSSNNIVCTDSLTTTSTRQSCPLNYDENYTVTVLYPNSVPQYTYSIGKKLASTLPTGYVISLNSGNACIEDNGRLYVYRTGSGSAPVGTTITVTGPPGYTSQSVTVTSSSTGYYFPFTTLPAGTYTASIDHGCGQPITATITLNGVYSGKELAYTTDNTCSGMRVTPTGSMTYQGVPTTTYYRLVSGPVGYDKTVIAPGGNFTFSTPGTYVLGILNSNNATGCVIKQVAINYTAPPLSLSQSGTNAYVCVDDTTGVILLKAANGVAPYTYQLWNKDNTAKVGVADIVSSNEASFKYGQPDSTYTVRVLDQCGNMFSQKITLAKLSTARVVYAANNNICDSDSIFLKCITLGNTSYNWTGPNNFTSTSQNPKIPNADISMTGWYKVSVMPEFCGESVQDSVYINVYPPLQAGTVTGDQELCVRTKIDTLNCQIVGGSNTYTYQWQISTDGTSWKNITGATSATYIPVAQIKSGTYYYRVIVSDTCGVVNSDIMTVNVTPCYLPVNPDLRSQAAIKKE